MFVFVVFVHVSYRLCILCSCAAHEEFESPAPAAGLTLFQSVSERINKMLVPRVVNTKKYCKSRDALPEGVCCEVALTAACRFQLHKGPSSRVKSAHHGETQAEDD